MDRDGENFSHANVFLHIDSNIMSMNGVYFQKKLPYYDLIFYFRLVCAFESHTQHQLYGKIESAIIEMSVIYLLLVSFAFFPAVNWI